MMRAVLGAAAALLGLAAPAEADDCDNIFLGAAENPAIASGRIAASAPRAAIFRNESDVKGCPAQSPHCQTRSYLLAGDPVILGARQGDFVCAHFVDPKGRTRPGWVLKAAVEPGPAVPPADWLGTWVRREAEISIKPGKADGLALSGTATWGADDSARVQSGGVNTGEFDAEARPDGAVMSFAVSLNGETRPIAKSDVSSDCQVWMARVGGYLAVSDNMKCGGMNVTFTGVYRKK